MKRLFNLFLAAAVVAAGLSGCAKEPQAGTPEKTNAYVSFTIKFNNDGTKADYGDDGKVTDVGTDAEHAVKYAYIYFFQNGNYVKTIEIPSADITSATSADNVIKKTTVPTKLDAGTYTVYATLNYKVEGLTETDTEDAFAQKTYAFNPLTYNVEAAGVPMSSRASDGTLKAQDVVVSSLNTAENPVQISLEMERVLAKVGVKKAADYTVYEGRQTSGTEVATVRLTAYKPVNLTENAYLYRHTGASADALSFGALLVNEYVWDPETSVKVKYTDAFPANVNLANWVNDADAYTDWTTTDYTHVTYCTENTMLKENQLLTYATGIAFKAQITPAASKYYATADDNGLGQYSAGGDLWFYHDCFYSSLDVLNAVNEVSFSANVDDANYYGKYAVKCFKEGVCYYTYFIKHNDNANPDELGVMEYGIVRNNDYQVTVTAIIALGDDAPEVDPEPIETVETFFQATLSVRPWIVRAQNAVLG